MTRYRVLVKFSYRDDTSEELVVADSMKWGGGGLNSVVLFFSKGQKEPIASFNASCVVWVKNTGPAS